jgi:hypothetical protein
MSRDDRRRSFRVIFVPGGGPRAEVCPFGAEEGELCLAGRVVDLSVDGAAVLLGQEVPHEALERPWVIGFELPLGPGVHRTVMLTCTLAHRRHRADGILYGVRFVELGLPVNAAQRQALELFLADLRGRPGPQPPPGADAPGTPPDTGNA